MKSVLVVHVGILLLSAAIISDILLSHDAATMLAALVPRSVSSIRICLLDTVEVAWTTAKFTVIPVFLYFSLVCYLSMI